MKAATFHIDAAEGTTPRVESSKRHLDFMPGMDWNTSAMVRKADGSYTGRACITNVGVFPYLDPETGKMRFELRCPEAVFAAESLESIKGEPLCNEHPEELVDPKNYKKYVVGSVGTDVSHNETQVFAPVTINEAKAISDFESKKRGLSCGYDADVVFAPVTFDAIDGSGGKVSYRCPGNYLGSDYDCIQTNIVHNHLALVKEGRAGDAARLRMDAALVRQDTTRRKDTKMKTIHLDGGVVAEGPDDLVDAFVKLRLDAKDMEKKLSDAEEAKKDSEGKLGKLQATCDTMKEELDAKLKELKDAKAEAEAAKKESKSDEAIQALVVERTTLLDTAKSLKVEVKHTDSAAAVKTACLKVLSPNLKLDGKDEGYINTAFETALSFRTGHADAARASQAALGTGNAPKVHGDASSDAKKAHMDSITNAWKD